MGVPVGPKVKSHECHFASNNKQSFLFSSFCCLPVLCTHTSKCLRRTGPWSSTVLRVDIWCVYDYVMAQRTTIMHDIPLPVLYLFYTYHSSCKDRLPPGARVPVFYLDHYGIMDTTGMYNVVHVKCTTLLLPFVRDCQGTWHRYSDK